MGDYTKNGTKIGTCGRAYYATLPMLQKIAKNIGESEAKWYIQPSNKASFAFPFPEYDGKNVGEITNFLYGNRAEFTFVVPSDIETFHKEIVDHIHPRGAEAINLFIPCPHSKESKHSNNFSGQQVFRLMEQKYYNETLHVVAECVYCNERNIFTKDEIELICNGIDKCADSTEQWEKNRYPKEPEGHYTKQAKRMREISKRMRETYQ